MAPRSSSYIVGWDYCNGYSYPVPTGDVVSVGFGFPNGITIHGEPTMNLSPQTLRAIADALETLEKTGVEVQRFIVDKHEVTISKVRGNAEFPYAVTAINRKD